MNAGNDIATLQVKRARFDRAGTLRMYEFSPPEKPLLLASYEAAYQIVKSKKPHTVGEELIKPCILKIADIVLGKEAAKEAAKKLQQVSLSNDVIHNRIIDMSEGILEQVIADIKASPVTISLQLDESTDVSNCSQLIAIV